MKDFSISNTLTEIFKNPLKLVLYLTLILLLATNFKFEWYCRGLTITICIVGLTSRYLLYNSMIWFIIGPFLLFFHCLMNWEFTDNHHYLISYWCIAIGCSLCLKDSLKSLAIYGRILIGLCFFFAFIAKLRSSFYMSGDMFHYLLLLDPRFVEIFQLITNENFFNNRLDFLAQANKLVPVIKLKSAVQIPIFAQFLTWFTLIYEIIVAIAFLIPKGFLYRFRDSILIVFMVGIYIPTNVIDYCWILCVMGIAQTNPYNERIKICYFLTIPIIYSFTGGDLKGFIFQTFLQ